MLQKRQAEEHKQLAEKFEAQCCSEQRTVEELRATVKNYEAQVEAVGADMQRFKDQHDMILGTLTNLKNNQNTSAPACHCRVPGVLAHMKMLEGVAMLQLTPHVCIVCEREEKLGDAFVQRLRLCEVW